MTESEAVRELRALADELDRRAKNSTFWAADGLKTAASMARARADRLVADVRK